MRDPCHNGRPGSYDGQTISDLIHAARPTPVPRSGRALPFSGGGERTRRPELPPSAPLWAVTASHPPRTQFSTDAVVEQETVPGHADYRDTKQHPIDIASSYAVSGLTNGTDAQPQRCHRSGDRPRRAAWRWVKRDLGLVLRHSRQVRGTGTRNEPAPAAADCAGGGGKDADDERSFQYFAKNDDGSC